MPAFCFRFFSTSGDNNTRLQTSLPLQYTPFRKDACSPPMPRTRHRPRLQSHRHADHMAPPDDLVPLLGNLSTNSSAHGVLKKRCSTAHNILQAKNRTTHSIAMHIHARLDFPLFHAISHQSPL
ncbi:hypothetical protein GGP41_005549 [Bipolaris sorokiniana]|uniref:Uncharacterized protein n=1 Tax=Cochliobolus sativus TaxID=45130 RepID=A0A8H5ZI29_COCSA|nr:hypothetical protein GGP41_005549 [Bipolaris sorokiniana]